MDNEVLLMDEERITMQVLRSDHLMMQTWRGYVPSAEFRRIMNEALVQATRLDVHRWFNDLRQMGAILQDDEKWTKEDWFPRLARTNVRRMAFLMSTDFFNQMSVDRIMHAGTEIMPLAVAYFGDEEEARAWLLSKESAMAPA